MGGYSLAHAVMMMIPEAWEKHTLMDENRRAFYEYHAAMMEPWDGPAAVAFTDGRQIGATLDRNGLRPARYLVTDDDLVVMASESGVLPIPEKKIVKKWRLQPGKMFLIDMEQGRIIDDKELKDSLAKAKPYREWIEKIRIKLDAVPAPEEKTEAVAGYRCSIASRRSATPRKTSSSSSSRWSTTARKPPVRWATTRPCRYCRASSKTLYSYFKQLFAQVTNPPIDPIREELVMSLVSFVGPKPNLLNTTDINPPIRLEVSQPVLTCTDMEKLRHIEKYTSEQVPLVRTRHLLPGGLGQGRRRSAPGIAGAEAEDAVRSGANILIVSDRKIDAEHVAIPALLATSAMHQHLVKKGLRTSAGLVVETGSAREMHHFALLGGYGAEAVHPYLALETIESLAKGDAEKADKYVKNFVKAIGKGLLKVMSKMGISTYMSYTGAQIFEAIGLQKELVDKYFTGTSSKVEGIGVFEVAEEAIRLHRKRFRDDPVLANMLDAGGEYAFRVRGEEHMWTPDSIAKLQHATRSGKYETYKEYAKLINDQTKRHLTLRGLFEFRPRRRAGPAGRSRAGQGNRQALCHRRHVARFDLDRGAHARWRSP